MSRTVAPLLLIDPFAVVNAVGLVAFALVGASRAIREGYDLLGIATVGLATAFAGGVARDLLVVRVPLALRSPVEVGLGLVGVGLAIALGAALSAPDAHPVTLVADAIGLAAFATTGAIVAAGTGLSAVGVVAIATINAVGGGTVADVLLDRAPSVLFEDVYASCAVLGGGAYWTVAALGADGGTAAAACAVVTVASRLAAVAFDWSLPVVRSSETRRD